MNDAGKPVAGRMRRPSWRDPRLLVGLVLIAVSVAAVATIVRTADQTSPYYAARGPIAPGTVLAPDDLVIVNARIGSDAYVPATLKPWGQVVTRVVGEGELLPADALSAPEDFDGRPVAVRTSLPLAATIERGAIVDVYVTEHDATGRPATRLIGSGLAVDDVVRDERSFGLGTGETVYVVVPSAQIVGFLEALAGGGDISVVGLAGKGSA
ncbi:MAG: hypothetical protein DIU73_002990 [Actinomycetes bacterium]|nr:MAG: hypothetical protein DIU73_05985 [Actinomycetota bacterium]